MKKHYLWALALILAVALGACSDNNGTDEPIIPGPDPVEEDLKESMEYKSYHVSSYGLAEDVKTMKRIEYQREWDSETETSIQKPSHQRYVEFDENQFLTKSIIYSIYIEGEEKIFKPSSEVSYKYDSRYRLIEQEYVNSMYSSENVRLSDSSKRFYEYDDEEKRVTIYLYTRGYDTDYTAWSKEVAKLNDKGRIDDETSYVHAENYYPPQTQVQQKSANKSARVTEDVTTIKTILHTTKDKKGNLIESYELNSTEFINQGNVVVNSYISSYFEQLLTYHDGTVSAKETEEEVMEGGGFVVKQIADYELNNKKAKTVIHWQFYPNTKWNEATQTVEKDDAQSKEVYTFKANGALAQYEKYIWLEKTQNMSLMEKRVYESDNKFRITKEAYHSFFYYDNTSKENVETEEITYDDEAKTAEYYIKTRDNYTLKIVHKLAADGTICRGNFDIYNPNQRSAKALVPDDKDFTETPLFSNTRVKNNDAKGNWIERYSSRKNFNNGVLEKIEIEGYQTREITYY